MSNMQVLNSNAKHAMYVFRKNQGKLVDACDPEVVNNLFKYKGALASEINHASELNRDFRGMKIITKRGKFTKYGIGRLKKLLEKMNLPTTATWQDVCDAVIKRWKSMGR